MLGTQLLAQFCATTRHVPLPITWRVVVQNCTKSCVPSIIHEKNEVYYFQLYLIVKSELLGAIQVKLWCCFCLVAEKDFYISCLIG